MHSILRTGRATSSCASRNYVFFSTTTACTHPKLPPPTRQLVRYTGRKPDFKRVAGRFNVTRSQPLDEPAGSLVLRDTLTAQHDKRGEARKTNTLFRRLVLHRLDSFMKGAGSWLEKKDEYRAFGLQTQLEFDREVSWFKNAIIRACELASRQNAVTRSENPLFWGLRNAFVQGDVQALTRELKYSFHNFLMRQRFSASTTATHKALADFRYPYEWFPATRALQRTIHLHVGPTNSGKTYQALKALENAKSGIYAGPLRLLAHEVYSRFIAKGKPCALITGEQQRIPEDVDNYFRSCTVEMTPLNHPVDVAVIDEIQMIGNHERGWAWTQAFLGVQAKEVHLCGEERSVELIQSLCDTIGDKCVIHRYKRLSPLEPTGSSVGSFAHLQKGDAVVAFSRVAIHAIKRQIEQATGKRCAIVYGSLPPETRAQQAALFNDPNNDYDYLVASDAIGMGLNLEIKRVVFEQTHKRDKFSYREMTTSEIKQIGGRAGRYRTASQAMQAGAGENTLSDNPGMVVAQKRQMGYVTAMEDDDLEAIHAAFSREPEPLKTAGLQAPPAVIERFSSYFPPNTPFSYILLRLRDLAQLSRRYHMCDLGEMLEVADLIQPFPMTVYDRCVFLTAPVFLREHNGPQVVQAYARCISSMKGGGLLDIPEVDLELLDAKREDFATGPSEYMRRLEALHKAITLYLWLTYRYSGVFRDQGLAFHVKELVEAKIDQQLQELHVSEADRKRKRALVRKVVKSRELKKKKVLQEQGSPPEKDEVSGVFV